MTFETDSERDIPSARAEQALKNCAAEKTPEDDEVEDNNCKKQEGRAAFEGEAFLGGVAGEVADRVAGERENTPMMAATACNLMVAPPMI
jgi:hypothetical protein